MYYVQYFAQIDPRRTKLKDQGQRRAVVEVKTTVRMDSQMPPARPPTQSNISLQCTLHLNGLDRFILSLSRRPVVSLLAAGPTTTYLYSSV